MRTNVVEEADQMLPRAEINVTPMIDVMLVLLIIFMVVTPIIHSLVVLPVSDHADARPEEPGEIVLAIDRNGVYVLSTSGGTASGEISTPRVTPGEVLGERLAALYTNRTRDRILYLKADGEVSFGRVEEAIGIARGSGVRVVAAVTEQRRPAPRSSRVLKDRLGWNERP